MLRIAHSMEELSFPALMEIYLEANIEHGQEKWPKEPEARQIALSQQDFYTYLHDFFSPSPVRSITSGNTRADRSARCAWSRSGAACCWKHWRPRPLPAGMGLPPS